MKGSPTPTTMRRLTTLAFGLFAAFGSSPAPADEVVRRGEYLVNTSGCHDCHTPMKPGPAGPEPDMARALSGHPAELRMPPPPRLPDGPWLVVSAATNTAWSGPWGISYASNLTPEPETGIGQWTPRHFIDTIRTGRQLGHGRAILPPMPIPAYRQFDDADLTAIYRYLRTPTVNRVPYPMPPARR